MRAQGSSRSFVPPSAPALLFLVLWATPAIAQTGSGAYVGASAGAYYGSADFVDGSLGSAGVFAGVTVVPWMDIEGEWQRPSGVLRREYTGTSVSFAAPGSTRDEIDRLAVVTRFRNERRSGSLLSIGVTFHPARATRRMMPRLFLGLTGHWVEDRTVLEHLVIPPGITHEQLDRVMPPQEPWRRNLGGLTVGGSVAIALTPHVSIAPDVRYDYGSIGDEINNALRATARFAWRF